MLFRSREVEDANNKAIKILQDAAQKANQRIRWSLAVLGITIFSSVAALSFAGFKTIEAKNNLENYIYSMKNSIND